MASLLRPLIGLACVAIVLDGSRAHAAEATRGPAVVELFTSEGCSSCPPAEAVLTALSTRGDVLTLGFHVTYWDGLGWRDRFGLPEAEARQRHYVASLGLAGAYTPQAIVNGQVDVLGSDRSAIERMIDGLPRPAAIGLNRAAQKVALALPALPAGACPCEILLVAVRPQAETAVGGGENRGRTLRASSVVRSISRAGPWMGNAEQREVAMPAIAPDVGLLVVLAQCLRDGVVTASGRLRVDGKMRERL
jgi:hypothetical protein